MPLLSSIILGFWFSITSYKKSFKTLLYQTNNRSDGQSAIVSLLTFGTTTNIEEICKVSIFKEL